MNLYRLKKERIQMLEDDQTLDSNDSVIYYLDEKYESFDPIENESEQTVCLEVNKKNKIPSQFVNCKYFSCSMYMYFCNLFLKTILSIICFVFSFFVFF